MEFKTNVMRILDKQKINYRHYCYADHPTTCGTEVAAVLGQNPAQVFKTLVTVGKSKHYYVFMLPVDKELDLKKAAASVGEKAVDMLKSKELLPLTGYVFFTTTIDSSAQNFESIIFSAGKIGYQVETSLAGLQKVIRFQLADIIEK